MASANRHRLFPCFFLACLRPSAHFLSFLFFSHPLLFLFFVLSPLWPRISMQDGAHDSSFIIPSISSRRSSTDGPTDGRPAGLAAPLRPRHARSGPCTRWWSLMMMMMHWSTVVESSSVSEKKNQERQPIMPTGYRRMTHGSWSGYVIMAGNGKGNEPGGGIAIITHPLRLGKNMNNNKEGKSSRR